MADRLIKKLNNKAVQDTPDVTAPAAAPAFRQQVGKLPLTPERPEANYYQLQEEDTSDTRLMEYMYGKPIPDNPQQAIQYVLGLPVGLSPERKDYYGKKAGELEERRNEATKLFNKNKQWKGWLEVAEIFGQGLIQLGAAKAGAKHGFDSSKVKINPIDWDKRYNRMLKELDVQLKEIGKKEDVSSRDMEREQGRFEDVRKSVAGNILKSAFIAEQDRKRLAHEDRKKGESVAKTKKSQQAKDLNVFESRLTKSASQFDSTRAKLSTGIMLDKSSSLENKQRLVESELAKLSAAYKIPNSRSFINQVGAEYKKTGDTNTILKWLDTLPISGYQRVMNPKDKEMIRQYKEGVYTPSPKVKDRWWELYGWSDAPAN